MRYFTSDLHFWHKGVIEYCKRPWATVEEMNEGLINNWNSVVDPKDEVHVAGDMFFCGTTKIKQIMNRLNGVIHLYLGNHDWSKIKPHRGWEFGFTSVQTNGAIHLEGFELVNISHFPYKNEGDHTEQERFTEHRLDNHGRWLLHGHVHQYWKIKDKQVNVGVDVWDYKPVSETQLLEFVRASYEGGINGTPRT